MAFVDELRYSKAEIQKHLDLPLQRQQIAERIRDAVVDEGVRNFFVNRLTYQQPSIGPLSRRLAQAYINLGRRLRLVPVTHQEG